MKFIRSHNSIVEMIETNSQGELTQSLGFNFGELTFKILNKKVTFYIKQPDKPWDTMVWSANIPLMIDDVLYETEDKVSSALGALMIDHYQAELDELAQALDDETNRAISAETRLQIEYEEQEERLDDVEVSLSDEIIRSTSKDAEHDVLISGLSESLSDEIDRAISAETAIQTALTDEIIRSNIKDGEHDALISGLTTTTNNLITNLEDEIDRATSAETAIQTVLTDEIIRSTTKDGEHDVLINDVQVELNSKQPRLVAGRYITIDEGNVISADSHKVYRLTQAAYDSLTEIDPEAFYVITDAQDADLTMYATVSALTQETVARTVKDIEHDGLISGLSTSLVNETNRATSAEIALNNKVEDVSSALTSDYYTIDEVDALLDDKQDTLIAGDNITIVDNVISASGNVDSGIVQTMIDQSISGKQDTLVSLVNIKTINGESVLGSGNLHFDAGTISGITSGECQQLIDASLNGKADESAFESHTGNSDIHITASERTSWNAKSDFSGDYNDLTNKPTIPTVPTNVSAFINDAQYATTTYVDSSVSGKQDTLIAGENITINGNVISAANSVDSGVVQTMIDESISGKTDEINFDAHSGNTDIHITAAERTVWNAKSDFSGDYNDLINKPTIPTVPTDVSAFNNDAQYATSGYVDTSINNLATVARTGSYNDLTNKPNMPEIWNGTLAEYDAITIKDPNTLYLINE